MQPQMNADEHKRLPPLLILALIRVYLCASVVSGLTGGLA